MSRAAVDAQNVPRGLRVGGLQLDPGGRPVLMLYNGHSLRCLRYAAPRWLRRRRVSSLDDEVRGVYDPDDSGEAAPHTDFVSRGKVRRLSRSFARVKIDVQNFDGYGFRIKREWFLGNLARVVGLDLYIVADKRDSP